MEGQSPLLSVGLPGLTFGMSLGRGLSIQLDPHEEVVISEPDSHADDNKCFLKDADVPQAMMVVHFHAIHDLVVSMLDSSSEVIIYATFAIGSIKKATKQIVYNIKNDSIIVFNEVKYFPIVVNPNPKEEMNKIVILVFACKSGEQHAVTMSKHKLIGRYENNVHKLIKTVVCREEGTLLSKKGNLVGKIEIEYGVLYGSFGYGQSNQDSNFAQETETSHFYFTQT